MHLTHMQDQMAHTIAKCAISGKQLPTTYIAAALDLGIDVDAIQSRPHQHIIVNEEFTHG